MKGTEVDNRRLLRQLSPETRRQRELAKLIRARRLELDQSSGQLRLKTERAVTEISPPAYQVSEPTWE